MNPVIKKPQGLSKKQISEIQELLFICNAEDNTNYVFDGSDAFQEETNIGVFLLYRENILVSAITSFSP